LNPEQTAAQSLEIKILASDKTAAEAPFRNEAVSEFDIPLRAKVSFSKPVIAKIISQSTGHSFIPDSASEFLVDQKESTL
jgi:hypothetical protein